MKRRGFTLIELVIVIVIIGILAAIAIPRYVDMANQARINAAKASRGAMESAITIAYAESASTGAPAFPDIAELSGILVHGVPKNSIDGSDQVVASFNGSGGWVYNQEEGTISSNDAGNTPLD